MSENHTVKLVILAAIAGGILGHLLTPLTDQPAMIFPDDIERALEICVGQQYPFISGYPTVFRDGPDYKDTYVVCADGKKEPLWTDIWKRYH